jgi:hypothetical protein
MTIQQFFNAYLDALRRQNAEAMADCHGLPCVVATRDDQVVLTDRMQMIEHCQRTAARLVARGMSVERYTVRSLLMLGDEFAVANIAWSTVGANHGLRTFHTAYNVRRHAGTWTIWAVTAHEDLH